MIVVVLPLIRNGWRLYGPAPEFDRVEAELARRERGTAGTATAANPGSRTGPCPA